MRVRLRAILMVVAVVAPGGCAVVEPHSVAKSPLAPLTVSPEAIMLEVFSAQAPQGTEQLDALWRLVDEQPLDPELRKRLAENGFRAGVLGPNVPADLAKLLKVTDRPVAEEDKAKVPLDTENEVNLRLLYAKSGKRNELVIPHAREELTILEYADGHVHGKTYHKAACRLELRAFPSPTAACGSS